MKKLEEKLLKKSITKDKVNENGVELPSYSSKIC